MAQTSTPARKLYLAQDFKFTKKSNVSLSDDDDVIIKQEIFADDDPVLAKPIDFDDLFRLLQSVV